MSSNPNYDQHEMEFLDDSGTANFGVNRPVSDDKDPKSSSRSKPNSLNNP